MDLNTLRFAKSHEWVSVDGDVATVGISRFAVEALTDLVHVEPPDVGATLDAGSVFGEVESVKAVSDLYAPVSGEVLEINEEVTSDPGMMSEDPYKAGWIMKVRMSAPDQVEQLMTHEAYQAECASAE